MNYNKNNNNSQVAESEKSNNLIIPSFLKGFINTKTTIESTNNDKSIYCFHGHLELDENDLICKCCGRKMHVNNTTNVNMKHLPIGPNYSYLRIERKQLICSYCGATTMQNIPFKEEEHFITNELNKYIEDLLSTGNFTNKEVSYITGVNRNVVKDIDKKRLMLLYTIDGQGKELFKPKKQAKFLGIDEFKLHDGYQYATHIIDYETGHILWIAKGKKKQVVYDFIEHVGLEWMKGVTAVACDMNSDFEEAFKEKCPHIAIVYDYFHIVKNFNEKVVNEIRKDEQKRLKDEGNEKAANDLKRTRFILTSSEETLKKKDKEAEDGKIISKGSNLFNTDDKKRKSGYMNKYTKLINENELFLILELIKEMLSEAFSTNNEEEMVKILFDIMELCEESGNKHLLWLERLLYNHFEGIITHATYKISSGKIEGINNKIKTVRRQAYGYPDDEYFFLKIIDMSMRNTKE